MGRMRPAGYVEVPYPWRAAIGVRSPHPASFYVALVGQTLNYRMPASRRFGPLLAFAGRRGLPERPLSRVVRSLPRRERADLDELGRSLGRAWPRLSAESSSLPAEAPELTLLALQRSAALTVFAFGGSGAPLLVAKLPRGSGAAADTEAEALAEALPTGLAPRPLGTVDGARVQEAIAGAPMRVAALTPARARALGWPDSLRQVTDGLNALAAATGVLVPVQCEYLSMRGLMQLQNTLDMIRENLNPRVQIEGILPTMLDSRTVHAKEAVEILEENFGELVFKSRIRKAIKFAEAPVRGASVLKYDPKSNAADYYRELAKEVLTHGAT